MRMRRSLPGAHRGRVGAGTVPDVVVVDHHDSYTWNLVHLVAVATRTMPTVVQHDEVTAQQVLRALPTWC